MRPSTSSLKDLFPANPGSFPKTTAARPDRKDCVEIQSLGAFVQQHEEKIEQLNVYELLWVNKGVARLTVDLQDIDVQEDCVYLLRPGHLRYLQQAFHLQGYHITVTADFFDLAGYASGATLLDGLVVFRPDEQIRQEAEEILRKIQRENNQQAPTRIPIVQGLFSLFMLYLSPKMETLPGWGVQSEQELTNKFMQSLKKNFTNKKLVADYAGELCVTPGHLNRIVKKISGFPVSYHIQQQIVLEAKRQARYSDKSMKEIAWSLGFDDTAHFSKYFKNNTGMNFSNFKKSAWA